jgi:hypothetical protein
MRERLREPALPMTPKTFVGARMLARLALRRRERLAADREPDIYIGSPETVKVVEPGQDQEEYRQFLLDTRKAARSGFSPEYYANKNMPQADTPAQLLLDFENTPTEDK